MHLPDGMPPGGGSPWAPPPGDDAPWWRGDPPGGRAAGTGEPATTDGSAEPGGTGTDGEPATDGLTGGWLGDGTGGVPEVMVLPDPGRNRPTEPVPLPTPRAESFWLHAIERGEDVPEGELVTASTATATATRTRPVRRTVPKAPRRPAVGMVALLALALLGTFFAWVSAEPLWLATGHSTAGTATVTRCTGDGVAQRCRGTFTGDGFTAPSVTLLGVDAGRATAGATVPARMVSADSHQAFVGATGWTLHLRWGLGLLLVVLCGLGIASTTGARRLENARARRRAVLLSTGAPVLVLIGFLVAAY